MDESVGDGGGSTTVDDKGGRLEEGDEGVDEVGAGVVNEQAGDEEAR